MKQVVQSYRTGELELAEVPAPAPASGTVIVRTVCSVVSVGTERYMLDLAKKSLVGKAMARPDLVRQVITKVRSEGFAEAYRQSMGRLDTPVPLGYSSAGLILEAGAGVEGFNRGDRVACAGSGFASHAELVRIPRTLVVRIPDNVSFEEAAFVALGGIALHGVRLSEATVGERVAVLGLGLLGLLAVQILKAAGCRVLGADLDPGKLTLARELGADETTSAAREDLIPRARAFTDGAGADVVLIFAASPSNEPIELAAEIARERGRIVVPGLVGLDLPRKIFYEKELSFRISRAWGPGLYDPSYEERGIDYPASFVRWTAQRNMGAFLDLIASGRVRLSPLVSHRFPLEQAVDVYGRLLAGTEKFTGVLLTYAQEPDLSRTVSLRGKGADAASTATVSGAPARTRDRETASTPPLERVRVGLVGAGQFARGTLLPALAGMRGFTLAAVATASGVSARHVARKHGMAKCATDAQAIIGDPDIDLVMILTRHGSHARLVGQALLAGKHVFVEKPLALDEEQLAVVIDAVRRSASALMVGFNRRFAPTTRRALELLAPVQAPLTVTIRANAGSLSRESWVNDPLEGGGPIVGEACHFVDLAIALTRSLPVKVHAQAARTAAASATPASDVTFTLTMASGSVATIVYTTGGDRGFPRERVEVFGGGAACAIENFRTMTFAMGGRVQRLGRAWSGVDRGYRGELQVLYRALREGRPLPVRFEEYVAATRATFAAVESLRTGDSVDLS